MEIRKIENLKIYDEFVENSPYNHYMKNRGWGDFKRTSTIKPIYLGFFKDNNLIGTALVLHFEQIIPYMYIPTGMCIDYLDTSLLTEALELLKSFAIDNKCVFLRIDPLVIRVSRDIIGNQIEGVNNEFVSETFKNCGFKHKGYGYAYDGSWHNRYTLIVDITKDMDTLLSNYTKAKQSVIKRHSLIGVQTRLGKIEELKYLCEFEKELSVTQGFKPHSETYFKEIINCFKDGAKFYITEVNLDTMISAINNELNSKKYAKDLEARTSKEKELEQAISLKNENGNILVIGAGLFIYSNHHSWDLYTYNKKSCGFLKPVDNLHYFVMSNMKNNNVKYYDMCGFSGSTSKNDPYYGLYNYKKSFNPEFIEWIGEFDFVIDKVKFKLFQETKKGFNRIRRKIVSILYKKD